MIPVKIFWMYAIIVTSSALPWPEWGWREPRIKKFMKAVVGGNVDKIREMVRKNPGMVNEIGPYRYTGLHCAVKWGRVNAAQFLIEKVTLETMNLAEPGSGETALHIAINTGTKCIPEMLAKGANVKVVQKERKTPLHYAARYGDANTITALLAADENTIDLEDEEKMTPLLTALRCGRTFDVVKTLIDAGANVAAVNVERMTALHYAAHNCGTDVMELLMGTSGILLINQANKLRHTPLLAAVVSVKNYRESGKETNLEKIEDHPDRYGVVETLIEHNANVEIVEWDTGNGPLYYAKDAGIVRLLAINGAPLNRFNKKGNSLLYEAISNGRSLGVIRTMINLGADVKAINENCNSLAHCSGLTRDILILIAAKGAPLTTFNASGDTPLTKARRRNRPYCDAFIDLID